MRLWVLCALLPLATDAQIITVNGASITLTSGSVVYSNGGCTLTNGAALTNNGDLTVTKNSSTPTPGTFKIGTASNANGSGNYAVQQDWINDGVFTANNSTVRLYGNTQQFISSNNGTITEFNTLILTGTGNGVDRRKTLDNVDARIGTNGSLQLNNRELATENNSFIVLNTSSGAITNSLSFGNEGFVSSLTPGNLEWRTNSTNTYLFPVGSSVGTLRYRPVTIAPINGTANAYKVRMNNTNADNFNYFLAQHDAELSDANTLFFHSIERSMGTSDVNFQIAYDPASDGDWSMIGHWLDNDKLWVSIAPAAPNSIGNYSSMSKSGWDFPDIYLPYVLANNASSLTIPNVFTPNNDGTNDVYTVTAKGITDYNIVIVNRWGNTVYESNDINVSWDGTDNGSPCSDGVYFYLIRAKSGTEELVKQGHITIYNN